MSVSGLAPIASASGPPTFGLYGSESPEPGASSRRLAQPHAGSLIASGLPTRGLSVPHGISVADLDHDGILESLALSGGRGGITNWKREKPE